jgi:hypothetical protein
LKVNLLPNLQLLAGTANIEKQDSIPDTWVAKAFPSMEQKTTYLRDNDLDGLPLELDGFLEFFDERSARIRERLSKTLGTSPTSR